MSEKGKENASISNNSKNKETRHLKAILAGGITGGLEICITYPTEYVKTHLQLDRQLGSKRQYNGIADCTVKTYQKHGLFGFYRGLTVLVYGSIPKSAVRFSAFEYAKGQLSYHDGDKVKFKPVERLFCGMFAGFSEACLVVTPMESIKIKFIQDQNMPHPKYKGFFNGSQQIIRNDGFRAIYQGLLPTVLKQSTNQMMRFFVMETSKDYYRSFYGIEDSSAPIPKLTTGLMGGLAGAVSVFGNTPIDVVKTRLQSQSTQYKGMFDCIKRVYTNEGLRGFYKGTVPRLGRVCLDVGITFMIYDSIMELFKA